MTPKRLVIIGGGISGLTFAYRVEEAARKNGLPIHITLLDAKPRFGGVIETQEGYGFLLESAADAFLSEKKEAIELCKELGLEQELISTQNDFRKSFIYVGGCLHPIPPGFYLMAPSSWQSLGALPLSLRGKLRLLMEIFTPAKKKIEDESVGSFVRRRFGQEVLERLAQPMMAGIYASDIEELSLAATFPRFLDMEKEFGSVIKGLLNRNKDRHWKQASGPRYSLFLSLKQGMGTLPERLESVLTQVEKRKSTLVVNIVQNDQWRIRLESGEVLQADVLCLAVPAWSAAEMMGPIDEKLSLLLRKISYESIATVNLAYSKNFLKRHQSGFGFVVPEIENTKILGCSFSSMKFQGRAPQNALLLRAFVGGEWYEELAGLEDIQFVDVIQREIEKILNCRERPVVSQVSRYPNAMPQYRVGHTRWVQDIEQRVEKVQGLYLTGNAYQGIGIPDCIRHATRTAETFIRDLIQSEKFSEQALI